MTLYGEVLAFDSTMNTDHNLRVVARTAELTASDDADDEDGWRFGGVAVGEGDILHAVDGTPVVFTADVLAEAAHTQAGEPLSKDHPEDSEGSPVYPPPVEETAGTVEKAGYVPGKGLVYEARTHDESIAEGVKAGSFDVSVHPTFDLGDKDPETGAYVPENVKFLDLATVSKGMSPSNTAEWGPNQSLASWTRQANIGNEIEAHSGGESDDNPPGWFRKWAGRVGLTAAIDEPESDESAESDADATSDTDTTMSNRENYIQTLVDNHGFEEGSLESMDDDQIETMHSGLVGGDDPAEEETETETETDDGNVVKVDIGDHDSVEDYISEQAEAAVASAQEETERESLIATISSKTDKDTETLAEWPTDALEDKASSLASAAQLPGSTGRHTNTVTASHSSGEEDTSAYGTGVEGN